MSMIRKTPSRRAVFQQLAIFGAGAPFAMNLAALGAAAAATPASDYKAMVCVFLQGGNDSNNLLLATDADTWGRYWAARWRGDDPIGLMPPGTPAVAIGAKSAVTGRTVASTANPEFWGGVLPVKPKTPQAWPAGTAHAGTAARTFAIHPMLPRCQSMFAQGRLACLANVGTLVAPLTKAQYQAGGSLPNSIIPPRLFSHNDQQSAWQSGQVQGAAAGWGGEIADSLISTSKPGLNFMSVTTAGSTPFPTGEVVKSYRVKVAQTGASAVTISLLSKTGAYNNSPSFLSRLRETILPNAASLTNDLAADYVDAVNRGVGTAAAYAQAISGVAVPAPAPFTDPIAAKVVDNPLADQLYAVAQTIAGRDALAVKRQVFFVQLGSFDTHDLENKRQGLLMAQIDHALDYFDSAMTAMGMGSAVTTFTASDFNRTFTTNGDGTDHAWGGHHIVLGGAVKGGDIYGQYPTLGIDVAGGFQNPDGVGNALIPTTSVDQYLATIAAWFGVPDYNISTIFPRLSEFSSANLGFV